MIVVDVSYHNGVIDWRKLKAAGVNGAIIRAGYGRDFTKYDDSKYRANMDGAISAGVKVGVYLYSYAKTEDSARSEAAHLLRLVAPYKDRISLPLYYDLEESGTESGAKQRAEIFLDIVEKAGYWCGVYANSWWWDHYLKGLSDKYTKWVADWQANDGKPHKKPIYTNMELWQYTSYGKLAGYTGLDLSEPYGKIAEILSGADPEKKEDKVMIELSVLRKGDKGEEVKTVQRILKELGYKDGSNKALVVDGSFGSRTEAAVKKFQDDYGLGVDGIVGSRTWNSLLKG